MLADISAGVSDVGGSTEFLNRSRPSQYAMASRSLPGVRAGMTEGQPGSSSLFRRSASEPSDSTAFTP